MSLLMVYRITASCIPAAMEYFRDKLRGTAPVAALNDEDVDDDDAPEASDLTAWTAHETRERVPQWMKVPLSASERQSGWF